VLAERWQQATADDGLDFVHHARVSESFLVFIDPVFLPLLQCLERGGFAENFRGAFYGLGELAPSSRVGGGFGSHLGEVIPQTGSTRLVIEADILKRGPPGFGVEFRQCLIVGLNRGKFAAKKAVADVDAFVGSIHGW